MKIKIIILICLIMSLFIISNCTIITNRWQIEWNDVDLGGVDNYLIIENKTGETIDTVKYYVGDNPPSSWDNIAASGDSVRSGSSIEIDIINDIEATQGETVWLRVSADAWYASKLFAVDGFVYETGTTDAWEAVIYNEQD